MKKLLAVLAIAFASPALFAQSTSGTPAELTAPSAAPAPAPKTHATKHKTHKAKKHHKKHKHVKRAKKEPLSK